MIKLSADGEYLILNLNVTNQETSGYVCVVFLQDDDDDLHEEPESWTESMPDVTVEGFSGWSARTR